MSFPAKDNRLTLGPDLVETAPVKDETREFSVAKFEQLLAAALGAQIMARTVRLLTSGAGVVQSQQVSWRQKGQLGVDYVFGNPTKEGTGKYLYAFQPTYPDHTGAEVAFAVTFAAAHAHGTSDTEVNAFAEIVSPTSVRVRTYSGGSLADVEHELEVS